MRRSNLPSPQSRALVANRLRYLVGDQAENGDPIEEVDIDVEPLPVSRFSRIHVAVVTVLVLVGLVSAGWALLRSRPVQIPGPPAAVAVSTPEATVRPTTAGSP